MSSVTVIQRVLPHYRVPFFTQLAESLAAEGISLQLLYGHERPGSVPRTVSLDEPWARRIHNRYLTISGLELVWQPCITELRGADLIIVEQANRLLLNYLLQGLGKFFGFKIALWGHGRNLQSRVPTGFRERFKQALKHRVDWWFAYTQLTVDELIASGYPSTRITMVQNTIDTDELQRAVKKTTTDELATLREHLDLEGNNICVYCGSMHAEKRIDFLLAACRKIRDRMPDFQMLFIGDGPEQGQVCDAASTQSWIRYVGPKFGVERVPYMLLGKALLMPGLVGLVVVDSFVLRIPIVTTELPFHSPEIAYIENRTNGLLVHNDLETYVSSVCEYLSSPSMQSRLAAGCAASSTDLALGNMVGNFRDGVIACLASNRTR
jgi:glycosyltransferase involved in cell wall biosynthesis